MNQIMAYIFEVIKTNDSIAIHDAPRFWNNYFEHLKDKKARLFIIKKDSVWFNTIWKSSNDKHKANAKPRFEKGAFKQVEYSVTNFQILWETIYDITIEQKEKVAELLSKKFPELTIEQCAQLSILKFDDTGMGSLSAKAIKKILPLMQLENIGTFISINEKVTINY